MININLNEINNKKWKVSPELKIEKVRVKNLEVVEQELHINICKAGYKDMRKPETFVDCGYQKYITRLSKSEMFTLETVLISTHEENQGRVLAVKGSLEKSGISLNLIKRKKVVIKDMEALRDRVRTMRKDSLARDRNRKEAQK